MRVGTRNWYFAPFFRTKDHPHACGDKYYPSLNYSILQGSSPRVWGQGQMWQADKAVHGIIPTRVGTRHGYGGKL